jgi:hypothetical protein
LLLVVLGVFVFSELDIVSMEDTHVRENMFPRSCFSLAIATATFSVTAPLSRFGFDRSLIGLEPPGGSDPRESHSRTPCEEGCYIMKARMLQASSSFPGTRAAVALVFAVLLLRGDQVAYALIVTSVNGAAGPTPRRRFRLSNWIPWWRPSRSIRTHCRPKR